MQFMKWITRSHVHVDRVACPWLITRFVDNQAEFLFVPKSEVDRVAAETGAIPSTPRASSWATTKAAARSSRSCSSTTFRSLALLRLARIVHAADVAEDIDSDPIARGLEAIASGFSLRYPHDEENLAAQFEVYDALYAWCRLQAAKGS